MKKKILSVILTIISFLFVFPSGCLANDAISVYLNNELMQFDAEPQILNGRTLVPMRAIFEKLGAEVTWDETTKTAYACNYDKRKAVSVTVGAPHMTAVFTDAIIPLDVPAVITNNRTLVPLRAVSEAFGCDVNWDGNTNTVTIYSDDFVDYSKVTAEQTTVNAATVTELLENIGNNKRIILTSDYYNLSDAEDIKNTSIERQLSWDDSYIGSYTVKNIVNMTIEGNAGIVTDDIMADVLRFENCGQITLSGLTIGHNDSYDVYQCEGAVTRFTNCDSININNCNLFGCGAFGIYADNVSNITVSGSKIYDCTYTGIWLTSGSDAQVTATDFFDSIHASGFLRIDSSNIKCSDCNIYNITCNDYSSGAFIKTYDYGENPSNINLINCNFTDNTFGIITNNDGDKKIVFDNCTFKNNTGNMEHKSALYNNASFE